MLVSVQHRLVAHERDDEPPEDALVLPVREFQAQMGMSIPEVLRASGWRFQLPTVLKVNGQYIGRAEWPSTFVSSNDNVEFLSRPLGGGSGAQTGLAIAAVVGLIALTAIAPYIGPALFGLAAGRFRGRARGQPGGRGRRGRDIVAPETQARGQNHPGP
jgi:sulfur carrier protein ThiS